MTFLPSAPFRHTLVCIFKITKKIKVAFQNLFRIPKKTTKLLTYIFFGAFNYSKWVGSTNLEASPTNRKYLTGKISSCIPLGSILSKFLKEFLMNRFPTLPEEKKATQETYLALKFDPFFRPFRSRFQNYAWKLKQRFRREINYGLAVWRFYEVKHFAQILGTEAGIWFDHISNCPIPACIKVK